MALYDRSSHVPGHLVDERAAMSTWLPAVRIRCRLRLSRDFQTWRHPLSWRNFGLKLRKWLLFVLSFAKISGSTLRKAAYRQRQREPQARLHSQ